MSEATRADSDAVGRGTAEHVPDVGRGHELRDVRIRPVALAFVALFVVAILVHVAMYGLLSGLTARDERASAPESPLAASYGRQAPPEPRLQIAPRDDLQRLRARESALLGGYAWVDRDAGVVRIPIERAIDAIVARGLRIGAAGAGDASGGASDGTAEAAAGGASAAPAASAEAGR